MNVFVLTAFYLCTEQPPEVQQKSECRAIAASIWSSVGTDIPARVHQSSVGYFATKAGCEAAASKEHAEMEAAEAYAAKTEAKYMVADNHWHNKHFECTEARVQP